MIVEFGGSRLELPEGAVVGLVGQSGSGIEQLLRASEGVRQYQLDGLDALERGRIGLQIARARRAGAAVLVAAHDERALQSLCDEVWWIHAGTIAAKGDPSEVLERYGHHIAQQLRALGAGTPELAPSLRRGDGRAELLSIETLGADEQPASTWTSGEPAAVRIAVRFHAAVADPVIGIMIRTRIGFEVYGTNTELEKLKLGPCGASDLRTVKFSFHCHLCPGDYTLTAASHDPDGVWHDWLEDAIAFNVVDSRYTAGVANLRATVTVE